MGVMVNSDIRLHRLRLVALALLMVASSLHVHAEDAGEDVDLGTLAPLTIDDIEVRGFCNPVKLGNGDLDIKCEGVPPEIVERMLALYEAQGEQLAVAFQSLEDYAERYAKLQDRYTELLLKVGDAKLADAGAALKVGDLEAAEARIAATEEALRLSQDDFRASAIDFMEALVAKGGTFGGVVQQRNLWASGTRLRVCFFNGTDEERVRTARFASEWTLYGNFSFDFGTVPSLRTCDVASEFSEIRIKFKGADAWSYIGNAALRIAPDSPTMGLPLHTSDSQRFVVLHEFGHALALRHMLQHPKACEGEFDWAYLSSSEAFLGMDLATLRRNLEPVAVSTDRFLVGDFDVNSIMMYHLPPAAFKLGAASKCFASGARQLSVMDKLAMYIAYPFLPDLLAEATATMVDASTSEVEPIAALAP